MDIEEEKVNTFQTDSNPHHHKESPYIDLIVLLEFLIVKPVDLMEES